MQTCEQKLISREVWDELEEKMKEDQARGKP